jgi:1,2-phenylacetyl-CoA epoxidase catalytic subunit
MAANYTTTTIRPQYHDAIVEWQKHNFPELSLLEKNWEKYFGTQTPFQLVAKVGGLKSELIEHGRFAGRQKFERASDLQGNMFYTARDIIRAQCSTELGSIQQHRLTLERATSDEAKFAVLRIMAEELRHAYQMFWVLDQDPTWKKAGHSDVAADTIEELLSMELGTHVLDAFNIEFNDFLDNVTYATVIDLVGKYQLDMQKVFSYAPVARSMGPMFSEEGFHLGSGRKILKEIAIAATKGEGDYSIEDVQRALNQWYPRGLEMFGNELGGETNILFGFKDKTNGVAQGEYIAEVQAVVDNTNLAVAQVLGPGVEAGELRAQVREIQTSGERKAGMRPEHFIFLPSNKFFRKRGSEEVAFQPYDVRGELLKENNGLISPAQYVEYLRTVLPAKFVAGREFAKYVAQMDDHVAWAASNAGFGLN